MVASFSNTTFKPDSTDPNSAQVSFINKGGQNRYYTVARFDFNLSSKQHVETIWNYNAFRNVMDFLNSVDPVFPRSFPSNFRWTAVEPILAFDRASLAVEPGGGE